MAIDLEAIRKKVAQLSGGNKGGSGSKTQLWKPESPKPGEVKEYKIRILPWSDAKPGEPLKELWFYYLGDTSALSLKQFGEKDPIDELMTKLFKTKNPDDKNLAKKLFAKMRAYAPIIDRSDEEKGVQLWSVGKIVHQRLLSFFLNEEIGDYFDPITGFDVTVQFTRQQGKKFNDTAVDVARRPSKLHQDPEKVAAWMKSIPNPLDIYKKKSYEELEKMLNDWLNSGGATADDGDGTARGDDSASTSADVQKLAEEVKATIDAPKTEDKTTKKKKEKDAATPATQPEFKSLDAAFDDLMADSQ